MLARGARLSAGLCAGCDDDSPIAGPGKAVAGCDETGATKGRGTDRVANAGAAGESSMAGPLGKSIERDISCQAKPKGRAVRSKYAG
jgi:hypothetical protein